MADDDEVLKQLAEVVESFAASEQWKNEEGWESFILDLRNGFNLNRRQAVLAARQVRQNFVHNAKRMGIPVEEYAEGMPKKTQMAIVGFSVGCVCQSDVDNWLDPETGDRKQPDYEI